MIKCEPIYTGGGIYCFLGQIDDNRYFMADDDCFGVMIVDSDPTLAYEECWYADWQEEHKIEELDEDDSLSFFREMLIWIMYHEPKGNYDMDEIERDFEHVKYLTGSTNWP